MSIFKFFKQVLSIVLLSALLVGCSSKSKSNQRNTIDSDGVEGNSSTEMVNAGEDINVTVGETFELNATINDINTTPNYVWSENDEPLPNGDMQTYTGSYNSNGEHNLTVTVTFNNRTDSDTISVKVGKYANKEIIKDCNGNILIVKIHVRDENGNLIKILEYRDLNGNMSPENDSSFIPYAIATYDENGNRTTIYANGEEETKTDNRIDGTGTVVTNDKLGTERIFTYEDNKLIKGKATYADGTIKDYTYNYENGEIVTETIVTTQADGTSTTETITFNKDGTIEVNTEDVGNTNSCVSTTENIETFIWDY